MKETFVSPQLSYLIIIFFSALWIGLGLWWSRRIRTTEDYLFAGRNVGLAFGTATVIATWCTGQTTMAAPELVYNVGIWGMFGFALGSFGLLFFAPLSKRIRTLMPRGFTSGDFVRLRYDRKTWALFLVISTVYFIGWLITQGMGAGLVLQAVSGIHYRAGMIVIVSVCTIYVLFGGMKAIIGTDFIQAILILALLLTLAVLVYSKIGFESIYEGLLTSTPDRLNLLLPVGLLYAWNTCLFSIGEIFHSNVWWARAYSFRPDVNKKAFVLGGLSWMTIPFVTGSLGFVALAQGYEVPHVNMIFPIVAGKILGVAGGVLVLIIIFCALASTIDSLLGATADLLVQDVYRVMINRNANDEEMRKASRWIVVGLGLLTIALAWNYVTTMALLLLFTGAMVGSTIWPIATGLYWKSASRHGAFWGMLIGSAAGLWTYFAIAPYAAALIGAAVSAIIVVVFARLNPEKFDYNRLNEEFRLTAEV
ncbi:urea transporter [bacterium]|nr:urea transporter [bacterium]MCI0604618.1 urea transporter [bacterium]